MDLVNNGKILALGKIAQTNPLVVTGITFDTTSTVIGSSYGATVTGSNLGTQANFDIRVRAPGSSADLIANNWQTGATMLHSVTVGTPKGAWTVTGVRAHTDPNNHTGSFVTTSTTLTVQ